MSILLFWPGAPAVAPTFTATQGDKSASDGTTTTMTWEADGTPAPTLKVQRLGSGGGLADTGLAVRYMLNEASSGTAPTSVSDASANAYDLTTVDYGSGNLSWSNVPTGSGLTSTADTGTQRVGVAMNDSGDALRTALTGTQKATIEVVLDYTSGSTSAGRVLAINNRTGSSPQLGLTISGTTLTPYVNQTSQYTTANLSAAGRTVIHYVLDATLAEGGSGRSKLYVNGVLSSFSDAGTSQGQTLSLPSALDFWLFNRQSSGSYERSITGTLYYAAIYADALTPAQVAANYDALVVTDDSEGSAWDDVATGTNFTGSSPLTYTTPTLDIALDDGSQWRAVATNSEGSVDSAAMTLTVTSTPVAPTITVQPTNQTAGVGATATFTASAPNGSPLAARQWQLLSGTWGDIAGATGTNYTTPVLVLGDDGKQYRFIDTNASGSVTSDIVTLTIGVAPTITLDPTNQSTSVGGTSTYTGAASGTEPITYQWQRKAAV